MDRGTFGVPGGRDVVRLALASAAPLVAEPNCQPMGSGHGLDRQHAGDRSRVPARAPFFLVSNHVSYCDIVLLLGQVHGVFVAKKELNEWPVIGYLTRLVGTIFVDRNSRRDAKRVLETIDQRVASGDGVIVFPEGTSSSGDDVHPMRTALFEWAAQTGKPVGIASIHYTTRPGMPSAREAVCWWGDMSFVPHVLQLCQMPGFDATLHFGDEPVTGNDRGLLAAQAREAVAHNFVPHRVEAP